MKLCQFTAEHFHQLQGRPIWLVDCEESYQRELLSAYDIAPFLAGRLDYEIPMPEDASDGFRGYPGIEKLPSDAVLLIANDYFHESFLHLCSQLNNEKRFESVYFFSNQETTYDLFYRKKYHDMPLVNRILFRSGPHANAFVTGMDFGDNARALFEYMLREGFNEKYELVWLVKNPCAYEKWQQNYKNVLFLPFDGSVTDDLKVRNAYYEALCLSKYIFFTDAYGFARNARSDQVRVQLWHGCGIKTRTRFTRCEKRYEYMIVTSPLYAELHKSSFGLRDDQVLVTGLPKEDWLFHPACHWQERLGIPSSSKYIFWLPTFRTTSVEGLKVLDVFEDTAGTGLPVVCSKQQLQELDSLLQELEIVLILKLHPFQRRDMISVEELVNVKILENELLLQEDLQLNELLGYADALISDYSSVAIDYTLLDRPMAFTLDDYEDYRDKRSLHWPNVRDYLPGEEIFNFNDFLQFVKDVAGGNDRSREKRQYLRQKFHAHFDDGSAARIVKELGIQP